MKTSFIYIFTRYYKDEPFLPICSIALSKENSSWSPNRSVFGTGIPLLSHGIIFGESLYFSEPQLLNFLGIDEIIHMKVPNMVVGHMKHGR